MRERKTKRVREMWGENEKQERETGSETFGGVRMREGEWGEGE